VQIKGRLIIACLPIKSLFKEVGAMGFGLFQKAAEGYKTFAAQEGAITNRPRALMIDRGAPNGVSQRIVREALPL